MTTTDAITGALSYTGKYIARRLIAQDRQILSLTGHPDRPNQFGDAVRSIPFHFENSTALTESLRGVDTLYNTYWVRFNYGKHTYQQAVANTRKLFSAAKAAGVRRVIHVSITQADAASSLPYFRGKGELEADLRASGLSYAILRPAVIFGDEDILINNIAYLLRHLPIFAVPGDGQYRLQPIFVEDLAAIAIQAGQSHENLEWDAVGPEIFTYQEIVEMLGKAIGHNRAVLHLPPRLLFTFARLLGMLLGDVLLTWEEVVGLMANTLVSAQPPRGITRLSAWAQQNADHLGRRYASEVKRHYKD